MIQINNYDTIELLYYDISEHNQELYNTRRIIEDTRERYYLTLREQPNGINSINISINHNRAEARVTISAKILGKNYLYGINIDTWEIVQEKLNNYFRSNYEPTITRADLTQNYIVSDVPSTINQLSLSINQSKFKIIKHFSSESIILEKNNKSKRYRDRLTIYNKSAELNNSLKNTKKDSKREQIHELLTLENINNILRAELNIKDSNRLKELLKIGDNKLSSVLCAEVNPLTKYLKTITTTNTDSLITDEAERAILYYSYLLSSNNLNIGEVQEQIVKSYSKYKSKQQIEYLTIAFDRVLLENNIKNIVDFRELF